MSASQDIQIEKIFSYDAAQSRTVSDVYVGGTRSAGRTSQQLLLIIDLPSRKESDPIVDELLQEAVDTFEAAQHPTPEQVLESILEALNDLIPALFEKLPKLFDAFNMLVAVTEHGQIHFSQYGDMSAYLITPSDITDVAEEPDDDGSDKIFRHITSGLINPGDGMILTTFTLVDYVAEEKLQSLVSKHAPKNVISSLENILSDVPPIVTFAAILIKFTTNRDRGEQPIAIPVQSESRGKKHEVAGPPVRKRTQGIKKNIIALLASSVATYFSLLKKFVLGIIGFIKLLPTVLLQPSERAELEEQSVERFFASARVPFKRLGMLPLISRITLSLIVLLIFVLFHVLIFQGLKQEVVIARNAFDEGLLQVSLKQQEANNAIIYDDETAAEQYLIAIDTILRSLKPNNREEQDQLAAYIEENERELNRIRKINYISEPTVFASLTDIPDTPRAITFSNDSVLLAAGTQIYTIGENSVTPDAAADESIALLISSDDNTIAITESGAIGSLTETSLDSVTVSRHSENTETTGAKLYGGNLYILDESARSIFRYGGNGVTFRAGTVWMENDTLLAGARDLAIDGEVYVITDDGSILKFLRGEREPFSYANLNPTLGSSSTIYTTADSDLLYILDPDNNRVVILEKDGSIHDQYTSPQFSNLVGMTPDLNEDTLYVATDAAVYILAIN